MQKIPTKQELAELNLQKRAMYANTRFQLSTQFLNTLIGRDDFDMTKPECIELVTQISVDVTDVFMSKMGLVPPSADVVN